MQPAKVNYKMYQGSTFQETYRWESQTKVYVPIESIAKSAPCVITTTNPHLLPFNWRFKVVGASGMKEINSASQDSYYIATAVTSNTVTINKINSLSYTAYTGGGVLEYNQPVPLTNFSARMQLRESVDSNVIIYEATSTAGQIVVDDLNKAITLTIPSNITAGFNFTTAVYSLELFNGNNVVPFLIGNITLIPEVTR